ncbi:fibrinogen-like protein A [Diadema setosum]|uniref:fibrinogen-like protein A n=1 Tax=Diadema setosum TaxID=31175 RepID=UPI003B3BC55C
MRDDSGASMYAHYDSFAIGGAEINYRLTAFGYSGNAGDALSQSSGYPFSTIDKINDASMNIACNPCCPSGGWWYKGCGESDLNGVYPGGTAGGPVMSWNDRIITFVEMKVKRR